MRVTVRFFAALREELGPGGERDVDAGVTVASLWRGLARGRSVDVPVRFAVNETYVPGSYRLREGDEVAIFPPVSGGG
jgi:molybdopterin synthase sulfur carrier subunit